MVRELFVFGFRVMTATLVLAAVGLFLLVLLFVLPVYAKSVYYGKVWCGKCLLAQAADLHSERNSVSVGEVTCTFVNAVRAETRQASVAIIGCRDATMPANAMVVSTWSYFDRWGFDDHHYIKNIEEHYEWTR